MHIYKQEYGPAGFYHTPMKKLFFKKIISKTFVLFVIEYFPPNFVEHA
jgi:hypothetical protein